MLSDKEKALLKKLELPYPCVAVKYRFEKPDAPHYDGGKLAYCQYVKYAQETGNHFYITAEDDACYGKMPLGMIGKPPVTASGQAGYDFGIYKSPVGASYISGDLWESKSSPVISCAWMYAYPVISGKVNHITTGFYHGLKRRKAYPAGLRMISIPYQKLPEFFAALGEMDWTTIAFREDAESKRELQRRMEHWQEMARASGTEVDLH